MSAGMSENRLASALAVDSPICGIPSANSKRFIGTRRRSSTPASRFWIALSSSSPFFFVGFLGVGRRRLGAALRRERLAPGDDRRLQRFEVEPEQVGGLAHEPGLEQHLDIGLAEAFEVEAVARDEVLQPLHPLRRADQPAGAAAHRIGLARARVDLAHRPAAAGGAGLGEREWLGLGRALVEPMSITLGITSPARTTYGVADADVAAVADRLSVAADALHVALVVQRRVRHDHAAHRHGPQFARGFSEPVRPTLMTMSSTTVVASWAANLCASAQRGERDTKPRRLWRPRSSTL